MCIYVYTSAYACMYVCVYPLNMQNVSFFHNSCGRPFTQQLFPVFHLFLENSMVFSPIQKTHKKTTTNAKWLCLCEKKIKYKTLHCR